MIKSKLKKVYSLVFRNCTKSVQPTIEADLEHEKKANTFDHGLMFRKVNTIVSGLDTKVNIRVSYTQQLQILC